MTLSPRFAINILAVVAGGFLAVAAMAFTAPIAGWVGFGVAAGVAVVALAGAIFARRPSTKAGHSVLALVALWSVVAALVFTGSALTWLVFAGGLAFVLAGLVDLTAHELSTERVVHSLDVRSDPRVNSSATRSDIAA
ncbi:hypothetical protein [Streptomyces sp. NPDC088725]|uniref:hypothetical protein n=1 Tax=Streptomyces sp. NPDC088725 TaxID=3365873 RepID=UPI00382D66FD